MFIDKFNKTLNIGDFVYAACSDHIILGIIESFTHTTISIKYKYTYGTGTQILDYNSVIKIENPEIVLKQDPDYSQQYYDLVNFQLATIPLEFRYVLANYGTIYKLHKVKTIQEVRQLRDTSKGTPVLYAVIKNNKLNWTSYYTVTRNLLTESKLIKYGIDPNILDTPITLP